MKKFRKLFGLIFFILVFISIFYGMKILETSEKEKSEKMQLKRMFHQNPDVYAWLKVDGTKIDYPVAQHPTDDTYYLSHDLKHNKTYYGAIFTELINKKTFKDPVTIIYGHAITDDSMFGSLDYFADHKVFEQHQTITISTTDKDYTYQIIAAYSYTDDHLYHTFKLGDTHHVAEYFSKLKNLAFENGGYYRNVTFDASKDKLLILSTCDAEVDSKRFVIHAIRKGEKNGIS